MDIRGGITCDGNITGKNILTPIQTHAAVSGALTVDWSLASVHRLDMAASGDLTFSNGQDGGKYILEIKQPAGGGCGIGWPSDVRWVGGAEPQATLTADAIDYFGFIYDGADSKYDAIADATDMQ